jgi:hypothetical protein
MGNEAKEYSKALLTLENLAITQWKTLNAIARWVFNQFIEWLFIVDMVS